MEEQAEAIETAVEEEVEENVEEVQEEVNAEAATEAEPEETEEEEEFVVSIGEDSPPQEEKESAPEWVKDLRKSQRETSKENKELKARLEQYEQKPSVELGKKPKLDDDDIAYDEDKLSSAMDAWYERKAQIDRQKEAEKEIATSQEKAWQNTLGSYEEKKTALKTKVKDYDDAEALVKDSLSTVYQGAILQGSKDPALLIFALGNNPKKLKDLSSIDDPAKFIWEVATMESQLKTSNRKVATKPEKKLGGSGAGNAVDSTLAKLERDAEKSGDRTKVIQYKQQKKRE